MQPESNHYFSDREIFSRGRSEGTGKPTTVYIHDPSDDIVSTRPVAGLSEERNMSPLNTARIAACAAALPLLAFAGNVPEAESIGTATNNTILTSQFIPAAAFTANTDADVFTSLPTASVRGHGGTGDVDVFGFVTGDALAHFDIDHTSAGFDSYLALFRSDGTLLADNDDSTDDPGSHGGLDAFIGSIHLNAGIYYIAVASGGNSASASFTGDTFTELARPDGAFGGFAFGNATTGDSTFLFDGVQGDSSYLLNISIPSPSVLGAAPAAALVVSRRRRR